MRRRKLFLLLTLIGISIVFAVVLMLLTDNSQASSKTWPESVQVQMLDGQETMFYPSNQRIILLSNDCNFCDSMVSYINESHSFASDSNVVLFWIDKMGSEYFSFNLDSTIASKPNYLLTDSNLKILGITAFPTVIQLNNGKELASVMGFNRSLLREQIGY